MKTNQLILNRWGQIGFTSLATLLGWGVMTPQAQAGFNVGVQVIPPNNEDVEGGSPQDILEGSNVFGLDSVITFDTEFLDMGSNSPLPSNVISNIDGGGNLQDLVNLVDTAGDVWETALPEFDDIDIDIAWANFGLQSLAKSSQLINNEPELVKGFQNSQNRFLLTSTINDSIRPALTSGVPGVPPLFIIDAGDFSTAVPPEEINEFEQTFISITPEDIEIDGLAAIFVPDTPAEGETNTTFPSSGTLIFNSQDLVFDIDGDGEEETIKFFLDDNPLDSEVFGSVTNILEREGEDSLSGINIGRSSFADNSLFGEEDENFSIVDLFSVILHELQHALGTTRVNEQAKDDDSLNNANEIVTNDGNQIPTDFEPFIHIDLDSDIDNTPTPVGLETVTFGERKCPSGADVLAVGEVAFGDGLDKEQLELNPCQALATTVPESFTIFPLLLFGAGGLFVTRQRFSLRKY
ncbi:MAG: hypothetical protein AB4372_33195 [Xenococcus sp. (in: cyanobacteria)]